MQSPFFQVETAAGPPRLTTIRFAKDAPTSELFAGLQAFFEEALAQRCHHYLIDMRELNYPSANLIALFISVTTRARQHKGEVILQNVSHTARDNFLTFSALNYLALGTEAAAEGLPAGIFAPVAAREGHSPAAEIELDAKALVEIAEPPLVLQLDKNLHPQHARDFFSASKLVEEPRIQTHASRVESKASNLYQLCDFVVEHAKRAGMKEKEIGKIRIAVYEACLNVIEHAYHSNPDLWIDLTVHYTGDRFVIVILDRGLSSEMKLQKEYDVQEAVEARRTGGFGMHIIKRAVDQVEYYPDMLKGNRLVLTKNLR
jgi:anti-sigma regulatory factor (Ser/Thr protein kinase)/anti-anti-sigma regulatory factor